MMKRWSILILIFLPVLAFAQASFEAFANAKQVLQSGYVEVVFTLKNADGSNFRAPDFRNFHVLSGPSRSMSTTIINGKVSKELSYSFTLQPKRTGNFTIGKASIEVNGRRLFTEPLTLEVVEGREVTAEEGEQIFIRAELNAEEAVIGQQLTLDYKLYTALDVDSYSILEESDYQGFFAQDLRRYNAPAVREVIDGVQYVTKTLKRMALFPQQAGTLTVAPLTLELSVLLEGTGSRNGFFFNRQTKRQVVASNEAQIKVNPLPPNPPASFTGAVGKFTADYSINRAEVSTDDVLSLRLVIDGNGDIKRVQPPSLVVPDSFEVYDPRILEESTYENPGGEIVGRKEIEYFIMPKLAGDFQLHPEFAYYDTDSNKYVVLDQQTFNIEVLQGTLRPSEVVMDGANSLAEDIRFIKLDTKLHEVKPNFFGSTPFWVLTALPFLLFGGIIAFKRRRDQQGDLNVRDLKIKRARQEALKHLKVAEAHLQKNASRDFYDEVSKAMLGYVSDKLQIPGSELTKDNVREKLQSLDVDKLLIEKFMHIMQTCEIALFAGKDNPEAMQETYDAAVEAISKIEGLLSK